MNNFETPKKNISTKLGKWSIIIGVASIVFFIISYLLAYLPDHIRDLNLGWQTSYFIIDNKEIISFVANALLCLLPVILLSGIIISILSIVKEKERRGLGVIGLIINTLLVMIVVCVFSLLIYIGRTPF